MAVLDEPAIDRRFADADVAGSGLDGPGPLAATEQSERLGDISRLGPWMHRLVAVPLKRSDGASGPQIRAEGDPIPSHQADPSRLGETP